MTSPSCSSTVPKMVVLGWPSQWDTKVANRARLWNSGQTLVLSNTSPTCGDAFRRWQVSVCKIPAMAACQQGRGAEREDRVKGTHT